MSDLQELDVTITIIYMKEDLMINETIIIKSNMSWKGQKNTIFFGEEGGIYIIDEGDFYMEKFSFKQRSQNKNENLIMFWILIKNAFNLIKKV